MINNATEPSGVPASNQPRENICVVDRPLLAELIREFNARLAAEAGKAGVRFLDIYTLTVAEDGYSNQHWHMDAHHLQPAAWVEVMLG